MKLTFRFESEDAANTPRETNRTLLQEQARGDADVYFTLARTRGKTGEKTQAAGSDRTQSARESAA